MTQHPTNGKGPFDPDELDSLWAVWGIAVRCAKCGCVSEPVEAEGLDEYHVIWRGTKPCGHMQAPWRVEDVRKIPTYFPQCAAVTRSGRQCQRSSLSEKFYCRLHLPLYEKGTAND